MVALEASTEDSLLINLPTEEELLESLNSKANQEQDIQDRLEELQSRDQEEDYQTLFDYRVRHTFIIQFTQEEWDGLNQDMRDYYDLFGTYKSNNYRRVDVIYVADDEVLEIKDVGIRSKGNIYSRFPPEDEFGNISDIHYMMKFNETFDYIEGTEQYEQLKKREVFTLEQLLFKRNNQWDPSYTNEVFAYHMFNEVGVKVPSSSFAEVQIVIDGKVEKVSFYNIFEHFDEEFIRRHFQEEPTKQVGTLYKGSWSATLDPITESWMVGVRNWETNTRPLYAKETNKSDLSHDMIIDFSYGINLPNKADRLAYLEENFNTENFMRAMAMNVLLGNPDDYRGNGNNFYYYFDETGYMTYIPFDYDNSMGNGWDGMPAFIDYTLGNDIYEWGHFDWITFNIPLWERLIEHEKYQIMYEDFLMEFINEGIYSEQSYLEIYNYVEALYGDTFDMYYDKEYFINRKIDEVTEDVEYYRSQR